MFHCKVSPQLILRNAMRRLLQFGHANRGHSEPPFLSTSCEEGRLCATEINQTKKSFVFALLLAPLLAMPAADAVAIGCGPPPRPNPCIEYVCNEADGAYEPIIAPTGTACKNDGMCSGAGQCLRTNLAYPVCCQ